MRITPDSYFRKYMINYCIEVIEVIKEEMQKSRSKRTRGRTTYHPGILIYSFFHRKATVQELLQLMTGT